MRIDEQFPSTYLKAADLQGRAVRVNISHVDIEEISGGERKPVVYFQGKEKGLVLNKTNSNNIAAAYGYETEDWQGQPVELFEMMVDYQGKSVPAIRIRVPRVSRQPVIQPKPANGQQQYNERNPPPRATADELDDSIPF